MRFLPLYENGGLLAPIDQETRLSLNSACTRCDLSKGTKTVCMPAEGHVGLGEQAPLLLVGESPGAHEDRAGRPFVGPSGSYLRGLIAKYWPGKPYVLDNALRCAQPSRTGKAKKGSKLGQERIEACRGYLAGTLDESMPARVLALGSTAVESILGRSPAIMSVIGGYGWCEGVAVAKQRLDAVGPYVPVYLLPNPAAVIANKWLRKEFEEHFREAVLGPLPVPTFGGQARVIEDGFDAAMAHADLDGAEWLVVDVESAGMLHEPEWFELLSVALTRKDGEHAYVWGTESLADPNTRGMLASILSKAKLVGQNGKYDLLVLRQEGFPVGHLEGGDVMLARRLLDAGKMARLEYTAELVGLGGHKEEAQEALQAAVALPTKILRARARRRDVKRSKAKEAELEALALGYVHPIVERALAEKWEAERYGFMLLAPDVLHVYNARDAVTTARLAECEMPRLLATPGIGDTWREIVSGATHAYMRIEEWGIAADRAALERFAYFVDVKQVEVLRRLQSYELNLRSPEQVAQLLFEKLGLPTQHKTDGGAWSTDEKALEKLKGRHPVVDDLLEWRRLDKLRSQYADGGPRTEPDAPFQLGHKGLVPHIHSDGRIHPNYKIAGTETGRGAASDPNLYNQPRAETEEGKMVRDIYVAPSGTVLIDFDQSQVELRVAADLSGDKAMKQTFVDGVDIYLRAAQLIAWVWKMKPEDITKESVQRQETKTTVLSLAYQKGVKTLAADLGIPVDKAERIVQSILGEFTDFRRWIEERKREVRRTGEVWTRWRGKNARRRKLYDIGWSGDDDAYRVAEAERAAVNSPIQGTANDYTMASVIEVVKWIEEESVPAKLVLSVYDSIMLEVEERAVEEVLWVVPRIMTSWPTETGVPLVADAKMGRSWGSLEKVKLR